MRKNLDRDCRLYDLALAAFRKVSPVSNIGIVEIMGDGSVKFHYVDDEGSDTWSIDIIHLIQTLH